MAHSSSAKKMIRVSEKKRTRNKPVVSAVKTYVSRAEELIIAGEAEPARTAVDEADRRLSRAAQKGVIHSNSAARRKSRLWKRFNTAFPAK